MREKRVTKQRLLAHVERARERKLGRVRKKTEKLERARAIRTYIHTYIRTHTCTHTSPAAAAAASASAKKRAPYITSLRRSRRGASYTRSVARLLALAFDLAAARDRTHIHIREFPPRTLSACARAI